MSTETTLNVSASTTQGVVAGAQSAYNDQAVSDIVDLIRAKYEDEGQRNFDIGGRAYKHAQWQKGNFSGSYLGSDFDTLMLRLRDGVRLYVPIKATSIRIADWVRCYVLRTLVSEAIGVEAAGSITFHEYRHLILKALSFSKSDLVGVLVDGWLDMIKGVAFDRSQGVEVKAEEFLSRFAAKDKELSDLAASKMDPTLAAAKAASDAVKAKAKAVSKANEDVTSSVSDALVQGHLTPEGVLGIFENVAKHHGIPLPTAFGFDPATCTVADCDLLASTMFQAGKYAEMIALRDKLDKMVSAVDKARAASSAKTDRKAAKVAAGV